MAVLFILALLLFGPKKLPVIARQVGKMLNEFKRASNEFKAQIESEISQLEFQERQKAREKEREEEQKILPPVVPAAESVQSAGPYTPPVPPNEVSSGEYQSPVPQEVNPATASNPTNA